MRATRRGVHLCSGNGTVLAAFLHLLLDRVICIDEMSRKPLHVNTHRLVLTDLVPLLGTFGDWDEEVLYPFVVNLEHRHVHFVLFVGVIIGRDSCKNLFARNWHDTLN